MAEWVANSSLKTFQVLEQFEDSASLVPLIRFACDRASPQPVEIREEGSESEVIADESLVFAEPALLLPESRLQKFVIIFCCRANR